MSLVMFIPASGTPTGVQLPSNSFFNSGLDATIYSGVQFSSDGNIYERQKTGGWSNVGTWLLNGTNSDFYIVRGTPSVALTTDAGAGPLVLSTSRTYDIQQSSIGVLESMVSFEIQNVGTDTLASRTYTFRANKDT